MNGNLRLTSWIAQRRRAVRLQQRLGMDRRRRSVTYHKKMEKGDKPDGSEGTVQGA